jgi:phosphoribosylaminoimidazole-succinocarboxamide synthase
MEFTDTMMTPTGRRKAAFDGKGEICAAICNKLFHYLGGYSIPTHFEAEEEQDPPAGETAEHDSAGGTRAQRGRRRPLRALRGARRPVVLDYPVIEFYRKHAQGQMVMVNDSHCLAFKLVGLEEMRTMHRIASKANAILRSFFDRRGMLLVELRLEFGKIGQALVIGDEISPDTCRIWDRKTRKKLDFDCQKQGTVIFEETYRSLKERVLA